MTKLDTMGKANGAAVRDRLVQVLQEEFGLAVPKARVTYDDMFAKLSFEISVKQEGGNGLVVDSYARSLEINAPMYGFKENPFGKHFKSNGVEFILTGYNGRAPRFPFLGKRVSDGKTYKFPEATIEREFNLDPGEFSETRESNLF